jgi:hypothetical protein
MTHHPPGFDVHAAFPNAYLFHTWNGGVAYLAESDRIPRLIVERTAVGVSSSAEASKPLNDGVEVMAFEDFAKSAAHIRARWPELQRGTADGVYFIPWIGERYATAASPRLLVLGESHYSKEVDPYIHLTQRVTRDYVMKNWTHRFWTQVARTVEGKALELSATRDFWRNVAFYNYVQRIVGTKPGARPTLEMWNAAQPAFLSVLSKLEPSMVLVTGKELWANLPSAMTTTTLRRHDGSSWPAKTYEGRNGREIVATYIHHPASRGFSWRKWRDVPAALRHRVGHVKMHTDLL